MNAGIMSGLYCSVLVLALVFSVCDITIQSHKKKNSLDFGPHSLPLLEN